MNTNGYAHILVTAFDAGWTQEDQAENGGGPLFPWSCHAKDQPLLCGGYGATEGDAIQDFIQKNRVI